MTQQSTKVLNRVFIKIELEQYYGAYENYHSQFELEKIKKDAEFNMKESTFGFIPGVVFNGIEYKGLIDGNPLHHYFTCQKIKLK